MCFCLPFIVCIYVRVGICGLGPASWGCTDAGNVLGRIDSSNHLILLFTTSPYPLLQRHNVLGAPSATYSTAGDSTLMRDLAYLLLFVDKTTYSLSVFFKDSTDVLDTIQVGV